MFDVDDNGANDVAFNVSTAKLSSLFSSISLWLEWRDGDVFWRFWFRSFPSELLDGAADSVNGFDVTCTDGLLEVLDAGTVEGNAVDRLVCVIFTIRSTPGTMAAGTGGVAGSGSLVGSLVGKRGGRTSGSLLYKFSFGDKIFISRNFKRNVSTHSCMISLLTNYASID